MGVPIVRVQPRQTDNPLTSIHQILALKQMMEQAPIQRQLQEQQLQENDLALQAKRQAMEMQSRQQQEQESLIDSIIEANGDYDKAIPLARNRRVSPQGLELLRQAAVKSRTELDNLDESKRKALKDKLSLVGQAVQPLLGLPDDQLPDAYARTRGELLAARVVTPEEAPEQFPGRKVLELHARRAMSVVEQLTQDRQREEYDLKKPGTKADSLKKQLDLAVQTLQGVRSNSEWQPRRAALVGSFPEMEAIIPREYSPEAVQAVRDLTSDKSLALFDQFKRENPNGTVKEFLEMQRMVQVNNPIPSSHGGAGGGRSLDSLNPETQTRVQSLARRIAAGEITTYQAMQMLGGQRSGLGGALSDALDGLDARIVPAAVRTQMNSTDEAMKIIDRVEGMVREIQNAKQRGDNKAFASQTKIMEDFLAQQVPIMARAVGHVGVLTQQDVDSVRTFFPGWKSAGFAPKFAMEKLKVMRERFGEHKGILMNEQYRVVPRGDGGRPAQSQAPNPDRLGILK